jgi:hypothetical protein
LYDILSRPVDENVARQLVFNLEVIEKFATYLDNELSPFVDSEFAMNLASLLVRSRLRSFDASKNITKSLGIPFMHNFRNMIDHVFLQALKRFSISVNNVSSRSHLTEEIMQNILLDFNIVDTLGLVKVMTLAGNWSYFKKKHSELSNLIKQLKKKGQAISPDFTRELEKIPFPPKNALQKDWEFYYTKFRNITIRNRNICAQLELNTDQIQREIKYFQTNQLLFDCLDIAYIADRNAVVDKLYSGKE